MRWIPFLARVAILVLVLGIWEISSGTGVVDVRLLPPFSMVVDRALQLMFDPGFQRDALFTGGEIAIAFAIVAPLALMTGFLLGENRRLELAVAPTLNLMMATPKSVFLPIFILALGIGAPQKVAYAVALSFFVIVPSAIAAVHAIPQPLRVAVRSFGATRLQTYLYIFVPAMAPVVIGGLRLGMIFTITGVLLAEMYASSAGIGRSIVAWGDAARMVELLAAVLLIVAFTGALNGAIQACERYMSSRYSLA
jgi:ABC-type nitrate/sulfonate/bicarbonate transport system permease component